MSRVLWISDRLEDRLDAASRWLRHRGRDAPVWVVGPSPIAVAEPIRRAVAGGAAFGWRRHTVDTLARTLAGPPLAAEGRLPAPRPALEATVSRTLADLRASGSLGRFAEVASLPGFPQALLDTLDEIRLAGVDPADLPEDLGRCAARYAARLSDGGLADRALILARATDVLRERAPRPPVLAYELAPRTPVEQAFVGALVHEGGATVPRWDPDLVAAFTALLGPTAVEVLPVEGDDSLPRVQRHLFTDAAPSPRPLDDTVVLLSAPGEPREAVEIVRRIHAEAARGVPFDRMAIALRSPEAYRGVLEEALARGDVPVWSARGIQRPDPSGRALLALLACRAEGLSASRFSEYLSLGVCPPATDEGAPPAPPEDPPFVPPEDVPLPDEARPPDTAAPTAARTGDLPVIDGTLRAPRRWERLLVDAAVIGGRDRWARRLAGLRARLYADRRHRDDGPSRAPLLRNLADLDHLERFALPLIDDLAALPDRARWGVWLDALAALAHRALRHPDRVLAVLEGLRPLADLGPIDLAEVRATLTPRLSHLQAAPSGRRHGAVFVGAIEDLRGIPFDVVFVPGLAERTFPRPVREDPLLLDADRAGTPLATNVHRALAERLALRLAIGVATRRVVLTWPRVDADQGRPRVPSFYGLEIVRAAEGALPGFDALAERAARVVRSRLAWPAPDRPEVAFDAAEHDLALLAPILHDRGAHRPGVAAYLLQANPHLARSLRARARRWTVRRWTPADGLVDPRPEVRPALEAARPSRRPYAPTVLESFAACPYRFLLQAIHGLRPREVPEPLERIDPRSRGRLLHEIHHRTIAALDDAGLLPLDPDGLPDALQILDATVDAVADRWRDALAPAIPRVWDDDVAALRADVRGWLRRLAEDDVWVPWRTEVAFGLPGGPDREVVHPDPVDLDVGLSLRGAIDLVERDDQGNLRVTDLKTGRIQIGGGARVAGGRHLQPALYALAAERLFPASRVVGGRLVCATLQGGFAAHEVPLDEATRRAVATVVAAIEAHVADGHLPAAPAPGACAGCGYRIVCGPRVEHRTRTRKPPLPTLDAVRRLP